MNSLTNKDKYRAFCETRNDIPIFSEPWWLDTVCVDGDWDVCLYEENGTITGALPYYLTTYKSQKVIRMPLLTPYLGVQFFFKQEEISPLKKYKRENKITQALINQLPKVSYIQQSHHPNITNWLPFYWNNFKQTTLYTFSLNIKDLESTYSGFHPKLKQNLRKASQTLVCKESEELALFYEINQSTFDRQNMSIPYSFEFLKKLDTVLKQKKQSKLFITYDNKNDLAGGYFIWDNQSVYYLIAGHRGINRVAMGWTMWHAIQYFSESKESFDFEGSMVKNIAQFFSGFGAHPVPYHHTFKGKNKIIDILKILKS